MLVVPSVVEYVVLVPFLHCLFDVVGPEAIVVIVKVNRDQGLSLKLVLRFDVIRLGVGLSVEIYRTRLNIFYDLEISNVLLGVEDISSLPVAFVSIKVLSQFTEQRIILPLLVVVNTSV